MRNFTVSWDFKSIFIFFSVFSIIVAPFAINSWSDNKIFIYLLRGFCNVTGYSCAIEIPVLAKIKSSKHGWDISDSTVYVEVVRNNQLTGYAAEEVALQGIRTSSQKKDAEYGLNVAFEETGYLAYRGFPSSRMYGRSQYFASFILKDLGSVPNHRLDVVGRA